MNFDELFQRDTFFFGVEVEDLAGDEAETTRGMGKFGDQVRGGVAAVGRGPGDRGERLGEKSVSGEDGNGFPEDAVAGGSSPAEVVIIHARKIVMDQRVGVNALDGTGCGKGVGLLSPDGPGGGEAKNGTEAFPPREEAVPHGLVNPGWFCVRGDQAIQGFFNDGKPGFPEGLRVHRTKI